MWNYVLQEVTHILPILPSCKFILQLELYCVISHGVNKKNESFSAGKLKAAMPVDREISDLRFVHLVFERKYANRTRSAVLDTKLITS